MKRLTSPLFSIFMVCVIALTACTEEMDINLPNGYRRLVVEGRMSLDTGQNFVVLSRSLDYFDATSAKPFISGARVSILEHESGQTYLLSEDTDKPGYYWTAPEVVGQQGYTYTLTISDVDIDQDGIVETYKAEAFLPYIAEQIDSVHLVYGRQLLLEFLGMPRSKHLGWNVLLYAKDPPTHEYYQFVSIKNGARYDTLNQTLQIDDAMISVNGVYMKGFPFVFFADSLDLCRPGDTIGMEIRSLSADYYRYINELKTIYGGSMPLFGSAPANVKGNVDNGAIGYFAAFGARRKVRIVPSGPTTLGVAP